MTDQMNPIRLVLWLGCEEDPVSQSLYSSGEMKHTRESQINIHL